MKRYRPFFRLQRLMAGGLCLLLTFASSACKDNFLDEVPVASLSPDLVLTNKAGFENYITALHVAAREEFTSIDGLHGHVTMNMGTDIGTPSLTTYNFVDYNTTLTPTYTAVSFYWNWAYRQMIGRANTIITYAGKPESSTIWATEAERNAVIA